MKFSKIIGAAVAAAAVSAVGGALSAAPPSTFDVYWDSATCHLFNGTCKVVVKPQGTTRPDTKQLFDTCTKPNPDYCDSAIGSRYYERDAPGDPWYAFD